MNPLHCIRMSIAGIPAQPQQPLEEDAATGEEVIGGRGGIDDGVEVTRFQPGHLQRTARGLGREAKSGFSLDRPPPLLDSGTHPNPLVGGVHHLREARRWSRSGRARRSRFQQFENGAWGALAGWLEGCFNPIFAQACPTRKRGLL